MKTSRTSRKPNKTVVSVRIWKRRQRDRWYCTIRRPGHRDVTRSCGSCGHRASAEAVGTLVLAELMKAKPQTSEVVTVQLELFLPPPGDTGQESHREASGEVLSHE